jgi:hypothetical protein
MVRASAIQGDGRNLFLTSLDRALAQRLLDVSYRYGLLDQPIVASMLFWKRRDGLNRPRRPSHHYWVKSIPGRLPGRRAPPRRLHESIIADGRDGVRRRRFGIR